MSSSSSQKLLATKLLALADVKVGGKRPQDIQVYNDGFYNRAMRQGSLGVGEAYMDGWWQANQLDAFFYYVLNADLQTNVQTRVKGQIAMRVAMAHLVNLQNGKRAYLNAQSHYDIGNDLYKPMLGHTMAYTCAYWDRGAKTLDQAQIDKFDLVCEKLGLKNGMKVLDPGCGWGGLSIHMARRYGCDVTCFTPAREQFSYIKSHTKGLRVKPILSSWQDYNAKTKFDRIASIGMLEHVGPKNYKDYLQKMDSILVDDGLILLHTIGKNRSTLYTDPWITKYIFPGGVLPSVKQISSSSEGIFILEDWHSMGANYDKTLMCWYNNFKKSYPDLDHDKYDEKFYRMWEYYLLMCAGAFRARRNQLWQIVFSKRGVIGGYKAVR